MAEVNMRSEYEKARFQPPLLDFLPYHVLETFSLCRLSRPQGRVYHELVSMNADGTFRFLFA